MKQILSKEDFLSRSSSELAYSNFTCPECGRDHKTPFKEILVGKGIASQIPEIAERVLGQKPRLAAVIYDKHIESLIQDLVIQQLKAAGLPLTEIPLGAPGDWLDSEITLGNRTAASLDPAIDILIAVGSGVICDLTKWIATQTHIPFILCGTAPSMNGYTSITATITENDIKISKYLTPADVVMLDTNLIATAPKTMIGAGIGDLAARAICNADWKLSHWIKGSYFCPVPYQMTAAQEKKYFQAAPGIGQRDPDALELLSEGILLSGLSMTILDGETSPSSGAEHVLSHFWDFQTHISDAKKNLHGAQVSIGTILLANLYDYFRKLDVSKLDLDQIARQRPSLDAWLEDNQAHFGNAAESFNTVTQKKYLAGADYRRHLEKITHHWGDLWASIGEYVATPDEILQPLKIAGAPTTLKEIQRTPDQALEAILYGGRYRIRYTLLDLAWELGIFPSAASDILEMSGVLKG